jgi:hypothetical protein
VHAVLGELVRGDIVAGIAGLRRPGDQRSDELDDPLLWPGQVLRSMDERCEFAVVRMLLPDERVGLEHGYEASPRAAARLAGEPAEVSEVHRDVAFVPGQQDRFHVREVLVQRGSPDTGLLGDLRHRH